MREILFRGKGISGKWYEGHYMALSETTYCFTEDYVTHPDNTKHYIVFDRMTDWGLPNDHFKAEIAPETLGQYTGLKDRNGMRIFEGDIIDHHVQGDILVNRGVIQWDAHCARWSHRLNTMNPELAFFNPGAWEVIGNIHDNPELVEVANDAD